MDALTIPEAAARAGVSPRVVREAIEHERVRAFRDAGRWRIPEAELERLDRLEPEPGGVAFEQIEERLAAIESRLSALEESRYEDEPASNRASMRPALAPLFEGPRAAPPPPDVEPSVRSLGASRILGGMQPPSEEDE